MLSVKDRAKFGGLLGAWGFSDAAEPVALVAVPNGDRELLPASPDIVVGTKTASKVVTVDGRSVFVIVLLIKLQGRPYTFGVPVNHYDPGAENPFRRICETRVFRMSIFDDGLEPIRELEIADMDVAQFQHHLAQVASLSFAPWSVADFEAAFLSVARFPEKLWQLFV